MSGTQCSGTPNLGLLTTGPSAAPKVVLQKPALAAGKSSYWQSWFQKTFKVAMRPCVWLLSLKAEVTWLSLFWNNIVSCFLSNQKVLLCLQNQTRGQTKVTCWLQQNDIFEAGSSIRIPSCLNILGHTTSNGGNQSNVQQCCFASSPLLTVWLWAELPRGQGFCSTDLQQGTEWPADLQIHILKVASAPASGDQCLHLHKALGSAPFCKKSCLSC